MRLAPGDLLDYLLERTKELDRGNPNVNNWQGEIPEKSAKKYEKLVFLWFFFLSSFFFFLFSLLSSSFFICRVS